MKLGLALLSCISLSPALWTVHLGDQKLAGAAEAPAEEKRDRDRHISRVWWGAPEIQRTPPPGGDPFFLRACKVAWGEAP